MRWMTLEVVGEELSEEFMDTRGQRVVWPIHWAIRALSRVRFIGRVRLYGFLLQLSTAVGHMDRRVSGRMRASVRSEETRVQRTDRTTPVQRAGRQSGRTGDKSCRTV